MEVDLAARVAAHPKYMELKAKRTRLGWWLTAVCVAIKTFGFPAQQVRS